MAKYLSIVQLKLLFCVLLRNEAILSDFATRLTVDHFENKAHQLLFKIVTAYNAEYSTTPPKQIVTTELNTILTEDQDLLDDSERDILEDILDTAYDPDFWSDVNFDSPKIEKTVNKFATALAKCRIVSETIRSLTEQADISNLPNMLESAYLAAQTVEEQAVYNKKQDNLFQVSWDINNPFEKITTGLEFFDIFMGGGAATSEVYLYMAPYGTCKTTVAVQLWAEASKIAAVRTDGKIGLSFYVSYEAPRAELQHRILMYDAQINRASLEGMGKLGMQALGNNPLTPKEYEKHRFKDLIAAGLFKPERQRAEESIARLNDHCVVLDMTGSDIENPSAGSRGLSEIVNRIKAELRVRGPEYVVQNVIIDYLGLMVDRDTTKPVVRGLENHILYQRAVSAIAHNISTKLKTHTWIIHQLSGEANANTNPTRKVHHTDGKGSKSVGENAHFCFASGALTKDGLGMLSCTKHRRYRDVPPVIIKLYGEFNCVVHADNFVVDSKGQIVDKATINAVQTYQSQAAGNSNNAGGIDQIPPDQQEGNEGNADVDDIEDEDF